MSRRLSLKVGQRNALVLARIQALKADHPFWGYRRIWAQLRFAEGLAVNKKRILRLMRGARLAGQGESSVEGDPHADAEQAAATGAQSVVGH